MADGLSISGGAGSVAAALDDLVAAAALLDRVGDDLRAVAGRTAAFAVRPEVAQAALICPVEALNYGRREDMIRIAHERIAKHPDKYVEHVYGETEGGGTSWLYISPVPFNEVGGVGLPALGPKSPAQTTETIQHAIFKGFAGPIVVATLLTSLNWLTRKGGHS